MKLDYFSTASTVAYFAYGSCMNQASLADSLGCDLSDYFRGPARLDGYRLAFNYPSVNTPACCANVEAAAGATVEGALYELPAVFLDALDRREGVSASRYARRVVQVRPAGAPVRLALCYRGLITLPYEAAPTARYRALFVQGLLDASVSAPYRLKTIAWVDSLRPRMDVDEGEVTRQQVGTSQ